MKRLRGGIAGCGFFAQFQIDAWRRMPEVELAAAADPDVARARQAAPRAYASLEEMLAAERLDFVDIATRPETHAALVQAAARQGVPVICQKPLAPTWEEAVAVVSAATQAGVRFMVHENWRWQPWYRAVKDRIGAGSIGRPVTYYFRTRRRDGLGPEPYAAQPYFRQMPRLLIHETLVHHIDTARFLFGDVRSVYAAPRRVNRTIAGEDLAYLLLTHTDGLTGCIDGHRFADAGMHHPTPDSPPMGEASFEGEEGILTVTAAGDVLHNGEFAWRNRVTTGYRGDSVLATQRHFIGQLLDGGRFESGGPDYLNSMGTVEAAYRSAAAGARIDVPVA